MKIKTLLAAVIFSASVIFPLTLKTDKAFAEAEYAIEMSIDTWELPRNWIIKPDYKVELPVRVSNNPGISYLSFLVRKADNVPGRFIATYRKSLIPFGGVNSSSWSGFTNGIRVATYGEDVYYDANDIICYIAIHIPDNAEVGDFYGVEFAPEFMEDEREFSFKKDGVTYSIENFGKLTGGGVRIVEDAPLYRIETDYITEPNNEGAVSNEPAPQDQEQPQQNGEQAATNSDNSMGNEADNSSNNNNSDKGNAAESTTVSATEESSESKTTTSTSKTTSSTTKVSTSESRKTTTVLTEIQSETAETSGVSQDKASEEAVSSEEKKKSHISELVAGGILAAGVIIFIILQKLTKKK